jgi:hypothetical protein
MPDTTHLALPLMEAAQAQKHVTHNEALAMLDGLVQLSVKSRVLATPPAAPLDGDRYLVSAAPTGVWIGHEGQVAISLAGAWRYATPKEGWSIWIDSEDVQLVFNGTNWVANGGGGGATSMAANSIKGNDSGVVASATDLSVGQVNAMLPTFASSGVSAAKGLVPAPSLTAGTTRFLREDASWAELQNLTSLGVNTTADATNRLAVNSGALLFNHVGNGVQVKVNKNLPTDTASFLFQTGFSGRAEIGTTGDNDFHFKVSGDGSTFSESFVITGTSGLVTVKNGLMFDPVASDPATPANGQVWYNSTTGKLRARQAGANTDVVGTAGGGGITDGDKGDITVSGSGTVWTLDAQSITNAKLATMAAGTIKANLTGADAAPTDVTPSQLLDQIGNTQGQLIYRGAAGWATLAPGAAGQVLQSGGAANPSWATPSGGGGSFTSATGLTATSGAPTLTKTSDYQYFEFSTSGAPNNTTGFTLPSSTGAARLIINNKTANSLFAFPPVGGRIDAFAPNVFIPHPANSIVQYISIDGSNNWTTIRLASPESVAAAQGAVPTDPGSSNLVRGTYLFAGRPLLGARAAFEGWIPQQSIINRAQIGFWQPPGNATTVPGVLGMAAPTALGTATARTTSITNRATRRRRLGYVSAATVGALSGHYSTAAQYTIGDGAGNGGFYYACRFVVSDAAVVAGARMFVGLRNVVAAPTNIEPNAQTNFIGVGQLSTSNNLHMIYGGSTAQAAIDLGANFPASTLSTDLYEITIYSPPGAANTLHYRVERVGTGLVVTGQLGPGTAGVTIPAATTLLAHAAWRTNNATALAVGLDICNIYFEQLD